MYTCDDLCSIDCFRGRGLRVKLRNSVEHLGNCSLVLGNQHRFLDSEI